jgi:sporulation protein YlmC with PRC-barrel domain
MGMKNSQFSPFFQVKWPGKEIDMSRKLMLLATIPLLLASPALAQSTDQAPAAAPGVETPPPPAASDVPTYEGTDSTAPMDSTAPLDTATPAVPVSGDVQILTEESDDQILVDRIVGMDVVDAAGNKIGTVDNIVLDKSGKLTGLVLSAGEILGMGGKTVAISWQDVAAVENAEAITVNLTEEQLAAAPEFRTKEEQLEEEMRNTPPTPDQMTPAEPAPSGTQ